MAQKTQTEKSKLTRARSWAKNQAAKKDRVAEQEANHKRNVELGSTARERYHVSNKATKEE